MTAAETLALIAGATLTASAFLVFISWLGRCRHKLEPVLYVATGETYLVCRCGERAVRTAFPAAPQ